MMEPALNYCGRRLSLGALDEELLVNEQGRKE